MTQESQKTIGNIFGFFPNLHTKLPHAGKIEKYWSAQLTDYLIKEGKIVITFLFQGDSYSTIVKETDFNGRIIRNGEEVGKIYLKQFSSNEKQILWGEWIEDDENNSVIIELF